MSCISDPALLAIRGTMVLALTSVLIPLVGPYIWAPPAVQVRALPFQDQWGNLAGNESRV